MRYLPVALITWLLAFTILAPPARSEVVNIAIIHTNDLRGRLLPFYYRSSEELGGASRRAFFIRDKLRHKKMVWLTLDAGDTYGGTPFSDAFRGYLDVEMLKRMQFDAWNIGVYDFCYGVETLKERISQSGIAISANILDPLTGTTLTKPYSLIERDGVTIGIFGLVSKETPAIVGMPLVQGVTFDDPIETAKRIVPEVRQKADIVIALTNIGVSEDIKLAGSVPGIDVIVGGLSEAMLNDPYRVNQTIIVQGYKWGIDIGLLKLSFEGEKGKGYTLHFVEERLVPVDMNIESDPETEELLKGYYDQFREQMDVVLGAEVKDGLSDRRIRSAETPLGNLIADIARTASGAQVALLPANVVRAPIEKGLSTAGDIYATLPFDDHLVKLTLTGSELKNLLDESARKLGQPGFPLVSGLSFAIYDRKAYSVTFGGEKLDRHLSYEVVTTRALAEGEEEYYSLIGKEKTVTGLTLREEVIKYFRSQSSISAQEEGRILLLQEAPPEEVEPEALPETTEDIPIVPVEEQPMTEEMTAPETVEETPIVEETPVPEAEKSKLDLLREAAEPLGEARTSKNDLDYRFTLSAIKTGEERIFLLELTVSNPTLEAKVLNFTTGQEFNFRLLEGKKVIWDYGYRRYFQEGVRQVSVEAGHPARYTAIWDGKDNEGKEIRSRLYTIESTSDSIEPVKLTVQLILP